MNEKQQTAVQWLRDAMNGHLTEEDMRYVINKALAMEREQIEQAYKADLYPCSDDDAEQYFTDTYQTDL